MKILCSIIIGYLFGSINMSIIISKLKGFDIREHGSKNAGATNTLRVMGKIPALIVLISDGLKAVAAILICRLLFKSDDACILCGAASILGHNFPLYFSFRGGKGVITSFCAILMLDWKIALILLGVFLIVALITKIVSISSILAGLSLPIASYFMHGTGLFFWSMLFVGLFVAYRHKSNIVRLVQGNESKLGSKK